MDIPETLRKIILLNEGDPRDPDYWLKLTDPDGVHSGKSGWSFGECQFDVSNNPLASTCLRECGFTDEEIEGVRRQTIDVKPLEAKLREHSDVIARYDRHQLEGCLTRARMVMEKFGVLPVDDMALLAMADYDNQYYLDTLDKPRHLGHFLSRLSRPFFAKDVLDFKLAFTKYGEEHPGDCRRRYMNILKVVQNA